MIILGFRRLQAQNNNLWVLLILEFWSLNFANLFSVRADPTTRQFNLTGLNYFPPGVRGWCFFITSSSVLWACSFCTISSASRMRRLSWGECSEGVSSLSYDSRIARMPSRSCREEQKPPLGIRLPTSLRGEAAHSNIWQFYPLFFYMAKKPWWIRTHRLHISIKAQTRTHSSNKINVAALKTQKLDCLLYMKSHIPCRKATCTHSNKQMATANRVCLLFGDTVLIQHGWMGFCSKIFSVVLDIFPAKEFQQWRNRIVTTEMKQIWQRTKWLRANIL